MVCGLDSYTHLTAAASRSRTTEVVVDRRWMPEMMDVDSILFHRDEAHIFFFFVSLFSFVYIRVLYFFMILLRTSREFMGT